MVRTKTKHQKVRKPNAKKEPPEDTAIIAILETTATITITIIARLSTIIAIIIYDYHDCYRDHREYHDYRDYHDYYHDYRNSRAAHTCVGSTSAAEFSGGPCPSNVSDTCDNKHQ